MCNFLHRRLLLSTAHDNNLTMVSEQSSTSSHMPVFKYLKVSEPAPAVCHCALNRPPVNAIDTEVWTELLMLLTHLEKHAFPEETRVLLITSAARGPIFSAGNDLNEIYVPATTEIQFRHFWHISTTFLSHLYTTSLTTIAALRGATPAAGCAIALCCDVRLAQQDATIGLNEVAIGLSVPFFWARLFLRVANSRARAERVLATGDMISAQQAHQIGIVDVVVEGAAEQLLHDAIALADQWAMRFGAEGRAVTKRNIRSDFAADWLDYANEEARVAWRQLSNPQTVDALEKILRKLGKMRPARM